VHDLRPPPWEWSFAEDGALALDRHDLWEEPRSQAPIRVSQGGRLKGREPFATVPGMSPPMAPQGRAARLPRRHPERERRRRRLAVLVVIAVVAIATGLVTAFGGSDHPSTSTPAPASASRLLPAGPPAP
jgi:hypothetical protein